MINAYRTLHILFTKPLLKKKHCKLMKPLKRRISSKCGYKHLNEFFFFSFYRTSLALCRGEKKLYMLSLEKKNVSIVVCYN